MVRLGSNNYLKSTSRPSHMPQQIFDNNLVAIHKSKVILMPNKPAHVGMCV